MEMRTAEIADAVRGELSGPDIAVDGVTTDSRAVRPGELFVPIVAARDGHEFIDAALDAGAAAYLTAASPPASAAPAIRVQDTSRALLDLGRWARRQVEDRVIGITGSVGKTSTKDLLAPVLATTYRTSASERSLNNEIGVPLTLANAPRGAEALIVEMGARGTGHIELLCGVARPTVGVVTAVASAHLEQFHSLDEVARAKGELVAALPADGCAVLNGEDERVAAMAGRTTARVLTFGLLRGDVVAEDLRVDTELRPAFRLRTPWGAADLRLAVHGAHQVLNALAAATAALAVEVPMDRVAAGLEGARLSALRMDLATGPSGVRVLNDSYNANPTSMAAALDALAALPAGRRIAVLGTMAELGSTAAAEHVRVAEQAARLGIRVVSVSEPRYGIDGPDAVDSIDEAVEVLGPLGSGDAVLVKASRVAALERLAQRLLLDES